MIKGIFQLKLIRPNEGIVKEVTINNTIESGSGDLKYLLVNHMTSSSGNAGILLTQNFTDSDVGGTSAGTGQNGKNGIFATSPSATASYTQNNQQEQSTDALFHQNLVSTDQPTANQSRWSARRTWGSGAENDVTGTDYVTNFYLGKDYAVAQGGGVGAFQDKYAYAVLTGSNRIQPVNNDIIDVTWTITVG